MIPRPTLVGTTSRITEGRRGARLRPPISTAPAVFSNLVDVATKAREHRAMIRAMPYDLDTRLAELEHQIARLSRRSDERRYGRDGRAVLSVRLGAETCALVRHAATERGCTIADLLRPAILAAVNAPSTTTNTPTVSQTTAPGRLTADGLGARLQDRIPPILAWPTNRRLASPAVATPPASTGQGSGAGLFADRRSAKFR
jgi:hypothetical protein